VRAAKVFDIVDNSLELSLRDGSTHFFASYMPVRSATSCKIISRCARARTRTALLCVVHAGRCNHARFCHYLPCFCYHTLTLHSFLRSSHHLTLSEVARPRHITLASVITCLAFATTHSLFIPSSVPHLTLLYQGWRDHAILRSLLSLLALLLLPHTHSSFLSPFLTSPYFTRGGATTPYC
jgi:hypothetical protein